MTASVGSFVGGSTSDTVTYLANIAGNTAIDVTITCTASLAGASSTVSSADLDSMDDLGITGQLVNVSFSVFETGDGRSLFDTDTENVNTGSDVILTAGLNLRRLRWFGSTRRFVINRTSVSTVTMTTFWTATNIDALSAYLILNDGTVLEFDPTQFEDAPTGAVRWEIPQTEWDADYLPLLEAIEVDQSLVLGIADAGSISTTEGLSDEATATVAVAANQNPIVVITADSVVDPGDVIDVSATVDDPDADVTTVLWTATGGSFGDTALTSTTWTAPTTPGDYTLTLTATDTDGQVGSDTALVIVNRPPSVTLSVPSSATGGAVVNISAAVSDPDNDTTTVLWSATGGSFGNTTSDSTTWTAPTTSGDYILTLVATDEHNSSTTDTATITVGDNASPTVSLIIPSTANREDVIDVEAVVSDPNGDDYTVLWTATGGTFANDDEDETTWTAPDTAGDYTLTLTATDTPGAETAVSQIVTVVNRAPTVTLTVPSTADRDEAISISATASDPDGDTVTVEWTANNGTFANSTALSTTFTTPDSPGTFTITLTATDEHDAVTVDTASVVVSNTAPTATLTVKSDWLTNESDTVSAYLLRTMTAIR